MYVHATPAMRVTHPKKGLKTITVKTEIYDYFNNEYLKVKDEYAKKGVNSFSAYLTYKLTEIMEKDRQK